MTCHACKHCSLEGKRYYCSFKSVLMGIKPYYSTKIPKGATTNYGFRACRFTPKGSISLERWL